ncbi:MAG: hypothetical protein EON95_13110 [Caulobacteraceae bacterium]|nr:MAG: hypothetical protein EON95_13110 [Caulobacteraceae bacterium]
MAAGSGKGVAPAAPAAPAAQTAETRRGAYWLGLLTVPIAFAVVGLVGGVSGERMAEMLVEIPVAAISLTLVAAVVLLAADFTLRALRWRKPWMFSVACGLALFTLCLPTGLPLHYLVLLALIPGLCGGWVLGWSRR